MATPLFDFSHLTLAERIELAEQLWDSLPPAGPQADPEQVAELRRRRAALEADGELGDAWDATLDDIDKRGA